MASVPRLILASGSPRRASVLDTLGLDYSVAVPGVDEAWREGEGPAELAERLARAKTLRGAEEGALSLGFDTVVAHRGEILGKPRDRADARSMILRLGGQEHDVWSGVAIASPGRVESAVESTRVRFRHISPQEVERYVATGEPMDKAGAYGIQGMGAAFVERVEGDFFNVMGFPLPRFLELLGRFGWRYDFGRLVPG